jgi:hypothetical protein
VFDHIRVEAANLALHRMCVLFGDSRSAYYDYLARQGRSPPTDDERLRNEDASVPDRG